jgi:signal transduction histidine kinase
MGDERQIKQVLLDLLSNAVKFPPEGGRIGIEARQADSSPKREGLLQADKAIK